MGEFASAGVEKGGVGGYGCAGAWRRRMGISRGLKLDGILSFFSFALFQNPGLRL